MKIAMLINQDNFKQYSRWDNADWQLIHMGNKPPVADEVIATAADVLVVDAVMAIGRDIIDNMPSLKMVHSQGVAYNGIELEASREKGIYVCNNAGVNARAVAEQAILLMLAVLKKLRYNEDMVYDGKQIEAKQACFANGLPELGDCRVGLVGYGAIGRALAERLKAFGCKLCYYTRSGEKKGADFDADIEYMPLDELYSSCDIISLHTPVTPETTDMINAEALKSFKRGAILINTARGELMDHTAVANALISGQLGGLGCDTLSPEPVQLDNPFLQLLTEEAKQRVALSPHIAGITAGSFIRTYERIFANISAVERGERPNCVVNGVVN